MATVKQDDFNDKNEEEKAQSNTAFSTGAGPVTQRSQAPASSQNNFRSVAERKGSGQTSNIQKYLQANKGAGQEIAKDIKQTGQTQAEKIGQNVDRAKNIYNQRAQQLGQQISGAEAAGRNVFNQAGQDQVQDQNIAQARQLASGQLGSLAGQLGTQTGGLQNRVQALQKMAGQVGTEAGRFQTLQNMYQKGGRQYNRGQQRLDQLLLQRGGAEELQGQLSNIAQGAQQNLTGLQQESAEKRSQLVSEADARRQALTNLIQSGSSTGQLEESLQQRGLDDIMAGATERAKNEIENREILQQDYRNLASKLAQINAPRPEGEISTQVEPVSFSEDERSMLENLGLSGKTYGAFRGMTEDDIYSRLGEFGTTDLGYKDAARQDEINRYKALASIVGRDPSQTFTTEAGNMGEAFTAGTGLTDAIESARKSFLEKADTTSVTGQGEGFEKGGRAFFGGHQKHYDETAEATQSIADYLKQKEEGTLGPSSYEELVALEKQKLAEEEARRVAQDPNAGRYGGAQRTAIAEARAAAELDKRKRMEQRLKELGYYDTI